MERNAENLINVKICVGTYCYVMGGHELRELKTKLPAHLSDRVKVEASVCLGCNELGEEPKPPYAQVNGELMAEATVQKIVDKLEKLIR